MSGAIQRAAQQSALGMASLPLYSVHGGQCDCQKCRDCHSPGKHPRTHDGLKSATADEIVISQWQNKWPDANLGLLTGKASNVIALDIDPRHGGNDGLAELVKRCGEGITETLTADTGGGGTHLLYQAPEALIKNSQSALAPGVDVRGENGYIVAPPSAHISGEHYRWRNGLYLPEPMSDALLDVLLTSQAKASTQPARGATILEGQRNDVLFRYAASLRGYGKEYHEILSNLIRENLARCQPPLPDNEIERIAVSAATYAKGNQGLLNLYRKEVLRGDVLKSTTRLVLLTLSIHADSKALTCFPSQETLCSECGMGDDAIRTHTRSAEQHGWLRIDKRPRANGLPGTQCHYSLTFPDSPT